ncbi:MAG: hypothetical protein EHM28_01430 [Spirochaetaceae bacterium]|nr:MAG: hypothetical protein EHM28_01430 [Spirochaetaceae bacterium]
MKRKLKFIFIGILLAVITTAFTSCEVLSPSSPEFTGSWYYQAPTGGVMATFTSTSFNLNSNAINLINMTGTLNTTITSYDETANRMICHVNSATGYYASLLTPGDTLWVVYSINGNQLRWNGQEGTYPAAPGSNIYIKQ